MGQVLGVFGIPLGHADSRMGYVLGSSGSISGAASSLGLVGHSTSTNGCWTRWLSTWQLAHIFSGSPASLPRKISLPRAALLERGSWKGGRIIVTNATRAVTSPI